MIKALHVIDTLGRGGAETALTFTLPALREHGICADVAPLGPPHDLERRLVEQGINVIQMRPRRRWDVIRRAHDLAGIVEQKGYEIVHAHLYFSAVTVALAKTLFRMQAITLVTFHNFAYARGVNRPGWRLRARRFVARFLYRRGVDHFVAVSQPVAEHYANALSIPLPSVISHPLPAAVCSRTPQRSYAAERVIQVLLPGRLVHEKGHIDLINAVRMLRESGVETQVTFAGDGPLREILEGQIDQADLRDSIELTGSVDHQQMLELMVAADVVVVPSRFEGFGLTALEAMGLGKPVIATSVGGLVSLIEHKRSGLFIPPADPQRLMEAIRMLANDETLRASLGRNARETVLAKFSPGAKAAELASVYRFLVASTLTRRVSTR
jgi:glycosyltransferase involved in cell wall biosynthesis